MPATGEGSAFARILIGTGIALLVIVALVARVMLGGATPAPAVAKASGAPTPTDRCVVCHDKPSEDPGGAHAAALIGCASCHLGDPRATTAKAAHVGMEPEPGALSSADKTCGKCHGRELDRVRTSLMATARGVVAVDRWAFGETATPDGTQTMPDVLAAAKPTPAEDHLRRLCGGCHLASRKDNRDDAVRGVGSGCSACHVATGVATNRHPGILGAPPDRQCLGCHSRSARISLSYQGLAEVSGPGADSCQDPIKLFDGRAGCRQDDDVHHRAGIACTDCHLHTELMGDGTAHLHAEQQTELRCETCHGPTRDASWSRVTDPITRDLLRIHKQRRDPDEKQRAGRRGTPVWNLRPEAGGWKLEAKAGGRSWPVRPTPRDAEHALRGHERLTCSACHAAWIPTCTSCHTSFDRARQQWDFGRAALAPGAWTETNHGMGTATPGLAVRADGRIAPAAPGMIATLDARAAGGPLRDLRAVSVFDPHTTATRARDCASCHASSSALGLGAGELALGADGPRFAPAHPDPDRPGVASDGWTRLLPARPATGTRVGARGLDAREQRRVLRVGVCVPCHDKPGDPVWTDFERSLTRLAAGGTRCRGKVWSWMKRRVPAD